MYVFRLRNAPLDAQQIGPLMRSLSATCEQENSKDVLVRFHDLSPGAEISRRVLLVKEYLRSVRTREGLRMAIDVADHSGPPSPLPWCEIEPFGAFGSGLHDTTSGCVELIEDFAEGIPDRSRIAVLDIGTGTGILSLVAHHFGMTRITAIDVSVRAVIAAFHNFQRNGIAGEIDLRLGDIGMVGNGYDLVLANLRVGILSGLIDEILARVTHGGMIIASGIMNGEAGRFATTVTSRAGLVVVRIVERNGWISCALRRENRTATGVGA